MRPKSSIIRSFWDVLWGPMDEPSAVDAWQREVRAALTVADSSLLSELFAGARETWGPERASRLWLETVSAFDANAVTG